MNKSDCVVYCGKFFTVEWFYNRDGFSQPFEYFLTTSPAQKRKFFVLVKRLAEFGKIMDITKFRNEGDGIYALKPKPDRYLCFFVSGRKLIITNGFCKKTAKMPGTEKQRCVLAKTEYLAMNQGVCNDENNV